MKLYKFAFVFPVIVVFLTAVSAFAQSETFSNPNVDYTFQVPDDTWKMTTKPSATSPNVEYVYGDRSDGHLEVRSLTVAKDAIMSDVIRDEEQKLQFRRGFVAGKEENFSGFLKGTVYNFEYVANGKAMIGRFYFLRAHPTTFYLLRFVGPKDSLRSIRNQTDSIARTFNVK